jgi:hypothetical protein
MSICCINKVENSSVQLMIYLTNSFAFNSAPQNLQVVNILKLSTGKSVVDSLLSNLIIEVHSESSDKTTFTLYLFPVSLSAICYLTSSYLSGSHPMI